MNDSELEALRSRAYGPGADIHLDAEALRRLKELEGEGRPKRPPVVEVPPEPVAVAVAPPGPFEDDEAEPEHPAREVLRIFLRRLSRVRRSTVLIALGVLAFATAVATALILVERVQEDPLQTGAVQIARLSVDSGYEIPAYLLFRDKSAVGFEEFHGLRAVVGAGGFFYGGVLSEGSEGECMNIYPATNGAQSTSNSFSGILPGDCGIGGFPASTQIWSAMEGLPEEFSSAFPEPTALQFVYDAAHREIVVFADQ